jgi:hypothetical protein
MIQIFMRRAVLLGSERRIAGSRWCTTFGKDLQEHDGLLDTRVACRDKAGLKSHMQEISRI